MVDVFISYSRTNKAVVQRLAEAVQREGYSVWWDAELPPHLSYGDVITEKIGAAKAAIVVWSAAASASEWVRAEADLARGQRKLIQTSVDDLMPPMPFNQIQFASIGDWAGEEDHPGWQKVKISLEALCGPRQPDRSARASASSRAAAKPPAAGAAPAPASGGGGKGLVIAGIALLLLLIGGGAYWLMVDRSGGPEARGRATTADARDRDRDRERGPDSGSAVDSAPAPAPTAAPKPMEEPGRFTRRAVIDDPDGYTNMRSAPSINAAILARIEEGQEFATYPQDGEWWQVRTSDGKLGYVSRSRIRLRD